MQWADLNIYIVQKMKRCKCVKGERKLCNRFCARGADNVIEQGKTDPPHNFAWLPLLKALKREAIQALGTNTAIFRILLGKHPAYTAATILQLRRDFLQGICGHFFLAVRDAARLLGKIK